MYLTIENGRTETRSFQARRQPGSSHLDFLSRPRSRVRRQDRYNVQPRSIRAEAFAN